MGVKINRIGPMTWHYEFDGWHAVAFLALFVGAGILLGLLFFV